MRGRARCSLAFTLVLLSGCAALKQCAYEGFNRDQWQQPQRVVAALEIHPGDRVADVGSGSGYFTFRLARAVGPGGKVYAVDIDREMNKIVAERAKDESVANVEVIAARPNDPLLPETGVDLILTANTYHHIENRVGYFAALRRYLRPAGRIAIIDFDSRAWFESLWSHSTPAAIIKEEMARAGYAPQREFNFLERQTFLLFTLPAQEQNPVRRAPTDSISQPPPAGK